MTSIEPAASGGFDYLFDDPATLFANDDVDFGSPGLAPEPTPVDTSFSGAIDALFDGDFGRAGSEFTANVSNFFGNFGDQAPALAHDTATLPQLNRYFDPFVTPTLHAIDGYVNAPSAGSHYSNGWYAGFTANSLELGLGLLGARTGLGGAASRLGAYASEAGGALGSLGSFGAKTLEAGAWAADKGVDLLKPFIATGTAFQGSVSYNPVSDEWGFAALASPFNYGTATSVWTGASWPIATFNDDGRDLNPVIRQMVDQRFNSGHAGVNAGASAWWDPFSGELKVGGYGPELNFSTSPNHLNPQELLPPTTVRSLGEGGSWPWFGIKYNYNGK